MLPRELRFQSHYGAIATKPVPVGESPCHLFQSHYGAIATQPPPHSAILGPWFQSHYGAIATLLLG